MGKGPPGLGQRLGQWVNCWAITSEGRCAPGLCGAQLSSAPLASGGPAWARQGRLPAGQRGRRRGSKRPEPGLARGTLEENIGGRSPHVKASSETSVRVERATFAAILAGAIEVSYRQRLCPHTRSEVIFPIDGMRGSVVEVGYAMPVARLFLWLASVWPTTRVVYLVYLDPPSKYTKYITPRGGGKSYAIFNIACRD